MCPKGRQNGDGVVAVVTGVDPFPRCGKVAQRGGAAHPGVQQLAVGEAVDDPRDVLASDQGIGQAAVDGICTAEREPGHGQVGSDLTWSTGEQKQ